MTTQALGLAAEVKSTRLRNFGLAALALFVMANIGVTQMVAYGFNYHEALGEPWWAHVYAPWKWFVWYQAHYAQHTASFHQAFARAVIPLALVFMVAVPVKLATDRRAKAVEALHGSAHWADGAEIRAAGLLPAPGQRGAGVYIGGWEDEAGHLHYLRHNGPEHVFVFAPTRSGKGVGLILPTLLSWEDSAVVYDLKGENWALTAGWRRSIGQKVLFFDPTDTRGIAATFNPLQEVRVGSEHEVADAMNVVQQIIDPDGRGLQSHWDKTSFMFLTGVVLQSVYDARRERRIASLPDVADTLTNPEGIERLYARMKENTDGPDGRPHAVIQKAAIDMLEKDERERGSVLSTAKTFFALYSDPVVARNIRTSDFRIRDLMNADSPVTLYIVVSPTDKDRLRPLVRLIITQIVRNLTPRLEFVAGEPVKSYRYRLLLMLDEFPALGKLPIFQEALAHIAGYGMKAYIVAQDLTQLYAAYTKDEAILSSCHVRVAYAPNKIETAQLLSSMSGIATVVKKQTITSGKRVAAYLGNVSETLQEIQRPLLTPDECLRLPGPKKAPDGKITEPGDMLVFVSGSAPIYGQQILFFRDPTFLARSRLAAPLKTDSLNHEPVAATA